MVVHAQTRGVVKDFLGWYSVMVSAAERHSAESDDGKETDAVHMAFQQDKTYFEVTQPQVIMKWLNHNSELLLEPFEHKQMRK